MSIFQTGGCLKQGGIIEPSNSIFLFNNMAEELVDNCVNYNCEPLPAYDSTIEECGATSIKSGAITLWLFECGYLPADAGNEADLDQMVTDGHATKLDNLRIGLGDPTEETAEPGTSCGNPEVVLYNRTATIIDRKVTSSNNEFWNTAKKRVYNGFVFKECVTSGVDPRVTYVSAEVSLRAFRKFADFHTTPQEFSATLLWSDLDEPQILPWTEAP